MSSQFQNNRLRIVIDGYNVLFKTPLLVAKQHQTDFQLSRARLVAYCCQVIDSNQLMQTAIVFDSKQSVTETAQIEETREGIQIVYASNVPEADQLIEEMIALCSAPKQMTVVTSDRKIIATARNFSARYVDSEDWYFRSLCRIPVPDQKWIGQGTVPVSESTTAPSPAQLNSKPPTFDPLQSQQRANRPLGEIEWDELADFEIDE